MEFHSLGSRWIRFNLKNDYDTSLSSNLIWCLFAERDMCSLRLKWPAGDFKDLIQKMIFNILDL